MIKVSVKNLEGVEMFGVTMADPTEWLNSCLENKVFGNPDEYTIETIDVSNDYNFLLNDCYAKRMAEYPSITDQLDALFHARNGDTSILDALDAEKAAVKAKYPKPVQS